MISAIASNGISLWFLKASKTTSIEIIKFLKTLFKLMKITNGFEKSEIGIILDNWRTHRSRKIKDYNKRERVNLYFISAYKSELASIKTNFSRIKSTVIKESKSCELNLKSKEELILPWMYKRKFEKNTYVLYKKLYLPDRTRDSINLWWNVESTYL